MKNPRTKRILLACGVAAGILFLALLCFYHLDYGELMDWDEARHGVSAYEMLQTGEPIVPANQSSLPMLTRPTIGT